MYVGIVFILGYMLTQSMCKVQCTEQTSQQGVFLQTCENMLQPQFHISLSCEACIGKRSCHSLETLAWIHVQYINSFFQMNSKFGLYVCEYFIKLCIICLPFISDFTVFAGIEPRTVACVRIDSQSCQHLATCHPHKAAPSHPLSELHKYLTRFPYFMLVSLPMHGISNIFVIDACFAAGV